MMDRFPMKRKGKRNTLCFEVNVDAVGLNAAFFVCYETAFPVNGDIVAKRRENIFIEYFVAAIYAAFSKIIDLHDASFIVDKGETIVGEDTRCIGNSTFC